MWAVKILLMVLLFFYPFITSAAQTCSDISLRAENEGTDTERVIYKVMSEGRLYFHSAPDSRCKSKISFLVKNDSVIAYQISGGYLFAGYVNGEGEITTGWLELSQLTETNLRIVPLTEEVDYVNKPDSDKKNNSLTADDYRLTVNEIVLRPGEPLSEINRDIIRYYNQKPELVFIGYGRTGRIVSISFPDDSLSVYATYIINDNTDEDVINQIIVSSDKYKTHRGIRVGDPLSLLFERYGLHDDYSADESTESLIYHNVDMSLIFDIGKNKKIKRITYLLNAPGMVNCTINRDNWSVSPFAIPVQKEVVSPARVWLYLQPDEQCKTELFIIRGDRILQYREYGDYAYINYVNSKNKVVEGWIKNTALKSVDKADDRLDYRDFILKSGNGQIDFLGKPVTNNTVTRWLEKQREGVSVPEFHDFTHGVESWTSDIAGFTITISRTNTIVEKRTGRQDAYISEISFKDDHYKTSRGIAVGDTYNEMITAYGENTNIAAGSACYYYTWFDRQLWFCFDNNRVITTISYKNYPESDTR